MRYGNSMLSAASGRAVPRSWCFGGLVLAAYSEIDEAFRFAWTIEPHDPVIAYYVIHHSATTRTQEDRARPRSPGGSAPENSQGSGTAEGLPFGMSLLQRNPTDAPVLPLARYAKGYARLIARDYDARGVANGRGKRPLGHRSDSAIRSDHASGDAAGRALGRGALALRSDEHATGLFGGAPHTGHLYWQALTTTRASNSSPSTGTHATSDRIWLVLEC